MPDVFLAGSAERLMLFDAYTVPPPFPWRN